MNIKVLISTLLMFSYIGIQAMEIEQAINVSNETDFDAELLLSNETNTNQVLVHAYQSKEIDISIGFDTVNATLYGSLVGGTIRRGSTGNLAISSGMDIQITQDSEADKFILAGRTFL